MTEQPISDKDSTTACCFIITPMYIEDKKMLLINKALQPTKSKHI